MCVWGGGGGEGGGVKRDFAINQQINKRDHE